MTEIYLVYTDNWSDSCVQGLFSTTLHGTIGIIKKRMIELGASEFKDFIFGEFDDFGSCIVSYKFKYSWDDDFEDGTYYIERFINITHKNNG